MQKISILSLAVKATAAVSANTFVTAAGATAAAGADAHGVATVDAKIGDLFSADVLGTTIVKVSADVLAGARVEVGANGGIAPLDEGIPVGRALEAGTTGDLVEMLIFQGASAEPVSAG